MPRRANPRDADSKREFDWEQGEATAQAFINGQSQRKYNEAHALAEKLKVEGKSKAEAKELVIALGSHDRRYVSTLPETHIATLKALNAVYDA
jgi:hypothetical protein